jgi:hypothetical protein
MHHRPVGRTILPLLVLLVSCAGADEPPASGEPASVRNGSTEAETLERETRRIRAEAARIDSIFQPLPLLTPAQENGLRSYANARQLERARALGVGRLLPPRELERLRSEGALVRLEDTEHWVVRDMDHSQPLAVPGVHALLTRIGERFQARLRDLGAPPYRLEVTSVLRTAEDQAALRRVNPNATLGESTHEYGTTIDVLYSAFSAPARPIVEIDASDGGLRAHLEEVAAIAAERVAGRRALELKAILGEVLLELQNEGAVMVTLERLQPVYHMTITRPE